MKNNWIEDHDQQIHSQRGEDGRIQKILEIIGTTDKFCVEFGAWDGLHNSNVLNLIKSHNYKAVLIEGSKAKFDELCTNMKNENIIPMHALVGFNSEDGLDALLEGKGAPIDFDLLSIDIDGNDYHAWKAVKKYQPKVVIIEFNPTIPNEVSFIQDPVPHLNHGASILSLVELGKEKGYELVSANLNNAFFVDKKYFAKFNISNNSVAELRTDKSRVTYIFSGYDGRIFIRGWQTLDLHGIPYNENRMQLLPRLLQGWDDSSAGFGQFKKVVKKTFKSLRKRNII